MQHFMNYFLVISLFKCIFVQVTVAVRNLSVSIKGCDLEVTWQPDTTLTRCQMKSYFISIRPQMTSWVPLDSAYYRYGNIGTHKILHVSVATRFHDNGCKDSTSKVVFVVPDMKISSNTRMEARVGDTVILQGKSEGPGEIINTTWMFSKLQNKIPVTVPKTSIKTFLEIFNTKLADTGNYTCVMAIRKCGQGEITYVNSTTSLTIRNVINDTQTTHEMLRFYETQSSVPTEKLSNVLRGEPNRHTRKQGLTTKDETIWSNNMFLFIGAGSGGLVIVLVITGAVICVRRKRGMKRGRRKEIVLPPRASAIDNYEEYRVRAESDPHIYSEPEEINSLNPGRNI